MSVLNVLVYVALIGYVLFKKVQGQPVKTGKKLFALPVILVVVGYGDLSSGASLKPVVITLTVVGAIISLGLGMLRGRADKLSTRDGVPFVKWGIVSLLLFVGNLVAKLILDLIGVAAGGAASTVTKSLIFTLGLTLLGEASVLFIRSGGATERLDQSRATPAQTHQSHTDPFINVTPTAEASHRYRTAAEPPASSTTSARSVAEAIERHHSQHRDRHHHHHDRHRHDRERS